MAWKEGGKEERKEGRKEERKEEGKRKDEGKMSSPLRVGGGTLRGGLRSLAQEHIYTYYLFIYT